MYCKGPNLDPCGTELFTENHLDLLLFKTTLKYRPIKKSFIHPYSFPSISLLPCSLYDLLLLFSFVCFELLDKCMTCS